MIPAVSASTPAPVPAEPKKTGWSWGRRLLGEQPAEAGGGKDRPVGDVCLQDRVVALGERLGQARPEGRVVVGAGLERRRPGPEAAGCAHWDHPWGKAPLHRLEDPAVVRARPIDLVDEDQRRDSEPPERPEQQRRLRLDALYGRDDEDGAVEHAEDALDLGDEVRVAGRVDEVDREIAKDERGDRGPDRDAAFALEVEGVGLGGAGVDAADVVDRAGVEEESLGESGLTGVDVGEDSEIERVHGASCLPRRCGPSGLTWLLP